MKRHYFGTDGIRGRFEEDFFNERFVENFGKALGEWFQEQGKRGEILIGRDTRASGVLIEQALIRGLNNEIFTIIAEGILPTPALSYLINKKNAIGGAMITASHNPAEDNGLKVFVEGGSKLKVADEVEIESILERVFKKNPTPIAQASRLKKKEDIKEYAEFIKSLLPKGCLKGWKMVLDTANGATAKTAYEVFQHLGGELICIGNQPTGLNINEGVGSEHPERLVAMVQSHKAYLGISYDGDGDRVLVCNDRGVVVPGDQLLGALALQALREGELKKNTLVVTIQSNMGLDWSLNKQGCKVVRVDVGDRNVLHTMEELGCNLGGESSGHIIYSDLLKSGDGLLTSVKLFECLLKTKKHLNELCEEIQIFPQKTLNLRIKEKKALLGLVHIEQSVSELQKAFGEKGRVLVRYSGTEPMLRLLVEHAQESLAQEGIQRLTDAVKKDLEVIKSA